MVEIDTSVSEPQPGPSLLVGDATNGTSQHVHSNASQEDQLGSMNQELTQEGAQETERETNELIESTKYVEGLIYPPPEIRSKSSTSQTITLHAISNVMSIVFEFSTSSSYQLLLIRRQRLSPRIPILNYVSGT